MHTGALTPIPPLYKLFCCAGSLAALLSFPASCPLPGWPRHTPATLSRHANMASCLITSLCVADSPAPGITAGGSPSARNTAKCLILTKAAACFVRVPWWTALSWPVTGRVLFSALRCLALAWGVMAVMARRRDSEGGDLELDDAGFPAPAPTAPFENGTCRRR